MSFERIVYRTLPDGTTRKMYPFHINLEGMKSTLLCRDDEDYDHMQKSIYLAALKTGSTVIIDISMSNHCHSGILATGYENACRTGEYIKQRQAQYLSWKYGEKKVLRSTSLCVSYLDSDWYVRNALAYIPRNASDTGIRIEDYRWSGYRGMFVKGRCPARSTPVASLTRREREAVFRTHEDLSGVPWMVNPDGCLEPASACDYSYLESAFGNDQSFFLKQIGTVNPAEMHQKLVLNARSQNNDTQMFSIITDYAGRWFDKEPLAMTPEQKARLLPYLFRRYRTSSAQLARCMKMEPEIVEALLAKAKM